MVLIALAVLCAPLVGLGAWLLFSHVRFQRYHAYKGLPAPEGGARYLLAEGWAMLTLAWWTVRYALRDALAPPEGPPTGPPVLFVHGITQGGSNMWGLRRALSRKGRPTRAVSHGRLRWSLHAHVPAVATAIREMTAGGVVIDVVAHSMGGVVVRLALAAHPDLGERVRRLVTLGSPHRGSAAGRGLPLGPVVRDLGRRSPLLAALPALPGHIRLTTITATRDLLVYPRSTCHLPGARTLEVPGVGHAGLVTHPRAHAEVVSALEEREQGSAAEPRAS